MISITTFNYGETSLEQLFKEQLASLSKDHMIHDKGGIKVNVSEVEDPDDENHEMMTMQYNWEFEDYDYLRIFIDTVIIAQVPRMIALSSDDDDYFDYTPNLIQEVHGFFKSLTEAYPYRELNEIASQPFDGKTWPLPFHCKLLIHTIGVAIYIFNALLDANLAYFDPDKNPENGHYFASDEDQVASLKLPLYR